VPITAVYSTENYYSVANVCIGTDRVLLRGQNQHISNYGLCHSSTVTICIRVKGGSARLTPIPGQIGVTYYLPDMITLDNSSSEPRAIMPCGHAIS